MLKIYSRYPLDNPHSRHRSLGESEYDQHRSTHPSTSSSLGGISGLKQREQPEKVTISTKTCHSLYAMSVDEYVCQAQA